MMDAFNGSRKHAKRPKARNEEWADKRLSLEKVNSSLESCRWKARSYTGLGLRLGFIGYAGCMKREACDLDKRRKKYKRREKKTS